MNSLSPSGRLALLVCIAAALVFVASITCMPYQGAVALKIVPILALVALAWEHLAGSVRATVVAALCFSAVGDVLLEMGFFVVGLGAFLVAQLTYAGLFITRGEINPGALCRAGTVVVMLVIISSYILPHAGEMKIPVALYMAAIGSMGMAAALLARPFGLVLAGAVAFIISDSLIGINRFVQPFEGAREWIMVTYYLAQVLLVCGVIDHASRVLHD